MTTPPQRKSPFEDCEKHAEQAAREGLGVSACPYRKNPYKARWITVFASQAQMTLPFEEKARR